MSRSWNDNEYGGPYRSGEYDLGYRNYDDSRYTDHSRDHRWAHDHDPRYNGPSFRYEGYPMPGQVQPFRGREHGYRPHGHDTHRDHPFYDERYYDNYRNYGYHDEPRGRYDDGDRFGESHQHRYHARTSDDWDRPATYNAGGYGAAGFGPDHYDERDRRAHGRPYERDRYGRRYDDRERW